MSAFINYIKRFNYLKVSKQSLLLITLPSSNLRNRDESVKRLMAQCLEQVHACVDWTNIMI